MNCDGCSGSCEGDCDGCEGSCTGACTGSCKNTCDGCDTQCNDSNGSFVGVNGVNRSVLAAYAGVNGSAKKCSVYVGINGTAKKVL